MTEAEWLSATPDFIGHMIEFAEDIGSDRKLRLFAVGCCGRTRHLLVDERSRTAIAIGEQYADGGGISADIADIRVRATEAALALEASRHLPNGGMSPTWEEDGITSTAALAAVGTVVLQLPRTLDERQAAHPTSLSAVGSVAYHVRNALGWDIHFRTRDRDEAVRRDRGEVIFQIRLLHDLFGNPFRPVTLDSAWLTSTVVALARDIYEERAFDRLPILADALMDAGCENPDILNTCRSEGVHVRGCWIIDLLIGKE